MAGSPPPGVLRRQSVVAAVPAVLGLAVLGLLLPAPPEVPLVVRHGHDRLPSRGLARVVLGADVDRILPPVLVLAGAAGEEPDREGVGPVRPDQRRPARLHLPVFV